jgi:hypothetical protein
MTTIDEGAEQPPRQKRADAQRNEQRLLAAAAAVFVTSGVEAPVRDIAAAAGVGMGTIYRHFPTRADLVVAVYRHQVEPAPKLVRSCWRMVAHRMLHSVSGLTSSLISWSRSMDSPQSCNPTASASTRCMPTSLNASCPFALSCSPPPLKLARSVPILMPSN